MEHRNLVICDPAENAAIRGALIRCAFATFSRASDFARKGDSIASDADKREARELLRLASKFGRAE